MSVLPPLRSFTASRPDRAGSAAIADGFSATLQRKVVENAISVEIENPEIVRLFQIAEDDLVMPSVSSPDLFFRDLVPDELTDTLGIQLVDEVRILERRVGREDENGSVSCKENTCFHEFHLPLRDFSLRIP
jgi:hypothetical protein